MHSLLVVLHRGHCDGLRQVDEGPAAIVAVGVVVLCLLLLLADGAELLGEVPDLFLQVRR